MLILACSIFRFSMFRFIPLIRFNKQLEQILHCVAYALCQALFVNAMLSQIFHAIVRCIHSWCKLFAHKVITGRMSTKVTKGHFSSTEAISNIHSGARETHSRRSLEYAVDRRIFDGENRTQAEAMRAIRNCRWRFCFLLFDVLNLLQFYTSLISVCVEETRCPLVRSIRNWRNHNRGRELRHKSLSSTRATTKDPACGKSNNEWSQQPHTHNECGFYALSSTQMGWNTVLISSGQAISKPINSHRRRTKHETCARVQAIAMTTHGKFHYFSLKTQFHYYSLAIQIRFGARARTLGRHLIHPEMVAGAANAETAYSWAPWR